MEASTEKSKSSLQESYNWEPAAPFLITCWVIYAGLIGGRGEERQLLATSLVKSYNQILVHHPKPATIPFVCLPYPSACPIQDSGPTVPHFSLLLKFIHLAHFVYQVFNPFMTRFALPMKFYPPEFHSINLLSGLWLSHSLAHMSNFQTYNSSLLNSLFFPCVSGLSSFQSMIQHFIHSHGSPYSTPCLSLPPTHKSSDFSIPVSSSMRRHLWTNIYITKPMELKSAELGPEQNSVSLDCSSLSSLWPQLTFSTFLKLFKSSPLTISTPPHPHKKCILCRHSLLNFLPSWPLSASRN